jgi:hypothetical protein
MSGSGLALPGLIQSQRGRPRQRSALRSGRKRCGAVRAVRLRRRGGGSGRGSALHRLGAAQSTPPQKRSCDRASERASETASEEASETASESERIGMPAGRPPVPRVGRVAEQAPRASRPGPKRLDSLEPRLPPWAEAARRLGPQTAGLRRASATAASLGSTGVGGRRLRSATRRHTHLQGPPALLLVPLVRPWAGGPGALTRAVLFGPV